MREQTAGVRARRLACATLAAAAVACCLVGCTKTAQVEQPPADEGVFVPVVIMEQTPRQTQPAIEPAPQATTPQPLGMPEAQAPGEVAPYGVWRSPEERMAASDSLNLDTPVEHVVYLTFDDGPSPNTPRILEILDAYGVKATWFVRANTDCLDWLPTIWDKGNQVAIHTYSHDYETIYASTDAYWNDLLTTGSIIESYLGFSPTIVRFPGGSVNSYNLGVCNEIFEQMRWNGYHYFDWNVSSGDGADHSADELLFYTIAEADGNHSSCVLMHDSAAKDTTVEALPGIIEYFISEGYVFDVLLADSFGYHF